MGFPATRLRRWRRTAALRGMVRETRLAAEQLVLPLFACPGEGVARPVGSMPGVYQHSVDRLVAAAAEAYAAGVRGVLLFGLPEHKDAEGSASWADDGIVQQALRALAREVPGLVKIADLCFCEYTDHGHCGVLAPPDHTEVDNDATVANLERQAVSLARAGADVIAPSDMMDGRVGAVRAALDAAGKAELPILSYACKFASGFYGPFREAAESAPSFGDRRAYQMDPANGREALREAALDVEEGADMLMVKPALPYLDVLAALRRRWDLPLAAYHVSGEYAMLKAAAERGWLDYDRVLMESLIAIRRAGADLIVTYGAVDAARLLAGGWRE
ncbi:MAG TPA: porphobilinogen synthase [Thermoanaerobaculia bacterium]|nr:porphobilinogen synthase [Thermoanaerobaculia bacterium]